MEAALISHHSCPESRRLTNRSSCTDVSAEQLWSSTCQRLLLQLEQLQSLARPGPAPGNKLTLPSDIQRLTSEMQDNLVQARDGCGDPSASKYLALGSRDVLESLGTAKRRCENLNRELVRQAQSHEELVGGVAAVKDANKRLLEQTQFQRDELETIAQQGVADEQRLQISAAKHANDYSSCQTESNRHLAAARSMASHRLAAARLKAADKLRHWRIHAQMSAKEASSLRAEAMTLRKDVQAFHGELKVQFDEVAPRVHSHGGFAEASARLSKAEQAVQALAASLKHEKESHALENTTASHRQGCMSSEMNILQGRLGRDLSQLVSQSQAMERSTLADIEAWSDETEMLKRRLKEESKVHARGKEDLAALLDKQAELQMKLVSAEQDLLARQQEEVQLRCAAQQTDAALAAATTCGRHLQQQIEEQSEALQLRNEAEVAWCRGVLDGSASKEAALRDGKAEDARSRAQAWELKVREEEEVLQGLDAQNLEAARECEELAREVCDLRAKQAAVQEQRRRQEDRLADDRREAVLEHAKVQAACEQLMAQIGVLEAELQRSEDGNQLRRRAATDAEVRTAARTSSADGELNAAKAELTDLKKRWRQAVELRSKMLAEVGSLKQQMGKLEAELGSEIAGRHSVLKEENSKLKSRLKQEKEHGELVRAELQQLKMQTVERLRKAQEEHGRKLALTHQAKLKAEGTRRADLKTTSEAVAAQQRHIQALEKELQSLRHLLDEHDCGLSRIREELAFEESNPIARAKEEVLAIQDSVLKAADEDATLSQQLEECMLYPSRFLGSDPGANLRRADAHDRGVSSSPGRTYSFQDLHSRIEGHLDDLHRHSKESRNGLRVASNAFREPATIYPS